MTNFKRILYFRTKHKRKSHDLFILKTFLGLEIKNVWCLQSQSSMICQVFQVFQVGTLEWRTLVSDREWSYEYNTQIWPGEVLLPQHVAWDWRVPRGRDLGWGVHWFLFHASHVSHAGVVADVVVYHGGEGWREAEASRGKKGRWFHQVTTENQVISIQRWMVLQVCVQCPKLTHAAVPKMWEYLLWRVNT